MPIFLECSASLMSRRGGGGHSQAKEESHSALPCVHFECGADLDVSGGGADPYVTTHDFGKYDEAAAEEDDVRLQHVCDFLSFAPFRTWPTYNLIVSFAGSTLWTRSPAASFSAQSSSSNRERGRSCVSIATVMVALKGRG